jgi:hypothetical protein
VIFSFLFAGRGAARELADLIPDDVGLCFQTDHLYGVGSQFVETGLYDRLQGIPTFRPLVAEMFGKPREVGDRLAARLKISPQELGERFANGKTMLAIWPGEFHNVETSRLLMLVESRDNQSANQFVEVLRESFGKSPATLRARTLMHASAPYFVADLLQGGARVQVALATLDRVALLASSEAILRRALELAEPRPTGVRPISDSPAYQTASLRFPADAAIRVFINPRPWDELVLKRLQSTEEEGEEAFLFDVLAEGWKAADYWVFAMDLGSVFTLQSFLHFEGDEISEPLRDVGRSFAGRASFLEHVPADAALAFAGRVDVAKIMRMLLDSRDPEQLQDLAPLRDLARGAFMGLDLFEEVLPNLGPDVGFYMTAAPDQLIESQAPVKWVGGMGLRNLQLGDSDADLALALDGGLRSGFQLAASAQNAEADQPTASFNVFQEDGISIVSIAGLNTLPMQVAPSYALAKQHLFLGTAPEEVRRCLRLDPSRSLAASPRFRSLVQHCPDAGQVLYMDCAAVRKAVGEHGPFMAEVLRHLRNEPKKKVEESLQAFAQFAQLGETLVFTGKIEDQGLSFSIAISPETSDSRSSGSHNAK